MVYNITTNGGRDENSHLQSQFSADSPQNTKLTTEEPPSQKTDYPPFVDQVPGLSLVLFAKSRKLKIFWCLVLFACTICGMWTIMLVITEYIQVPTATSIAVKLVPSLELPAITICPQSPDALNYGPLFSNIQTRLPDITNETAVDLISFWLAGSGLVRIQPALTFTETRLVELAEMFKIWSDGYDTQRFFHMIQDEYGYKCEQLFTYCRSNGKKRNCCKELFRPVWVLSLGACYQTRRNINQTETDNDSFLHVEFKSLPSVTVHTWNRTGMKPNTQPGLEIYVNDNYVNDNSEHVAKFPVIYLYPNGINQLRLNARLVELQHSKYCTNKIVGKDASCFVNKWLTSHLLDPFNCTVPYLEVPGISNNTKTCDPLTIVKNYTMIGNYREGNGCIPGCTKWEYGRALVTTNTEMKTGFYHLNVGFDELQYEHVREFSTISISGLISQVGGQLGLYLGISIITLFQIVIYGVNTISHFSCRFLRRWPENESK